METDVPVYIPTKIASDSLSSFFIMIIGINL